MREWNIKPGDKLSVTLAADARLGPTDYCNDQIWELVFGEGALPGLTVQSTLGLRARSLRLFPRFWEKEQEITDPDAFSSSPIITQVLPNFLAIKYSPFPDIDVTAEYWVPQSDGLAGRIKIHNHSHEHRLIRFDWIGQLTPTEGQRMAITEIDAAQVLWGETEDLHPVVYLTGGAEAGSGSYPALTRTLELPPGEASDLSWSHTASNSREFSLQVNRDIAGRRWEAEKTRMEMLNTGNLQIFTGDPQWDFIFTITQNMANGLLVGPGTKLPYPSFVLSRQPDQGFSRRGDGTDYNHLWNGQSAFDAYYLSGLILPGTATYMQGIVKNFLATSQDNGFIDWKPGIAGQQSQILATPCLASLAWRIYEHSSDVEFLHSCFDPISRFVSLWLSPEKDRDGDGLPEWDHPIQMGFDDHPIFSRWQDWSAGLDITTAETSAMGAMLYREILSLIKISTLINQTNLIPNLEGALERLRTALTPMWDPGSTLYHDVDRDTHLSQPTKLLGRFTGNGILSLNKSFQNPTRIVLHIHTGGETVRQGQFFVHGTGVSSQSRVERITGDKFKWLPGRGVLTGERLYTSLDKIEIQNLSPLDELVIYSAGYYSESLASLLPLWAGLPDQDQAKNMVEATITNPNKFWRTYGLPAFIYTDMSETFSIDRAAIESWNAVHLPWNSMIGEGLVSYGYRSLAAELINRLMSGIALSLKSEGVFRHHFDSETGRGSGERNILHGFAPLTFFMETLGVRLISPQQVVLSGFNPFPWPVTVKYRGVTILRQRDRTVVVFPDGQIVNTDDPSPQVVSLS